MNYKSNPKKFSAYVEGKKQEQFYMTVNKSNKKKRETEREIEYKVGEGEFKIPNPILANKNIGWKGKKKGETNGKLFGTESKSKT